MKVSSGILFIKERHIFMAHVTGQKQWDIPKGQPEEGEDSIDAAIRECQEETGFVVKDKKDLKPLGVRDYNSQKKLDLFLYTGDEYPDEKACVCTSFFFDRWDRKRFEVDSFKYIDLDHLGSYATKNLTLTIEKVLKEI